MLDALPLLRRSDHHHPIIVIITIIIIIIIIIIIRLQVYDSETDTLVAERTYGCLPPAEAGLMLCRGGDNQHDDDDDYDENWYDDYD